MNNALVSSMGSLAVPVGNLDAYIAAANQIEILSASDERNLALRFRDEQDLAAAREMVVHHLRFVIKIARGYMGYGLALGDLIQEGNIGLMKAVKRFNPDLEVRLVSFAVHWIRAEIHEFVLRNWRIVKVATTKAQRKLFFNLRSAKKRLAWFDHAEVESVAADLGVTSADVLEMESRLSGRDIGFDIQPDDSSDHQDYAPAAYLEAHGADPAQHAEQEDWESYHGDKLGKALVALDARSQDILKSRWLNEESKATLTELAEKYEVSAERIRQLESAAMLKLKKLITA